MDLGLTKHKTHNFKFPKIAPELYAPFIRGYWGGNGLITVRKNTPYIHLNSKSESLIFSMKGFLASQGLKSGKTDVIRRKNSITYQLSYHNYHDVKKFYFQLFRNVPAHITFSEQEIKLKNILSL